MASMASQQLHILHIDLQEIRGQDRRHDPRASAGRGDQAQIPGPVLMWIAPKKIRDCFVGKMVVEVKCWDEFEEVGKL